MAKISVQIPTLKGVSQPEVMRNTYILRNGNTNVEKIFRNINPYNGYDAKITALQNYCGLFKVMEY